MECDRSDGPTNNTSTPSTAAMASAFSTAAGDSIWTMVTSDADPPCRDGSWSRIRRRGSKTPRRARRPADSAWQRRQPALRPPNRCAEHDSVGAEIEDAMDALPHRRFHAHNGDRSTGCQGLNLGQRIALIAGAVLEIDERPVIAGIGHQFGGGRRSERKKNSPVPLRPARVVRGRGPPRPGALVLLEVLSFGLAPIFSPEAR